MSAIQNIGKAVYHMALENGADVEMAKRMQDEAKAKARFQLAEDDPARAAVNQLQKRLGRVTSENLRLHREREALITALAGALGVDEPTAYAIARLDIEVDEVDE